MEKAHNAPAITYEIFRGGPNIENSPLGIQELLMGLWSIVGRKKQPIPPIISTHGLNYEFMYIYLLLSEPPS